MTYPATTSIKNTRTASLGFWLKGLLVVGLLAAQAACGSAPFCEALLEAREVCGSDRIPSAGEHAECLAAGEMYGHSPCENAKADLYMCQSVNTACVAEELSLYCAKEKLNCDDQCGLGNCQISSLL